MNPSKSEHQAIRAVPKTFKWTLEVEVAECWVADGFDFDADRCQQLGESLIGYAESHEVKVRVVKTPDPALIRKAQGHES